MAQRGRKPVEVTDPDGMLTIQLPYNFRPRPYQVPVMVALDSGIRRAMLIWHRRCGKDLTMVNYTIKCMFPGDGVRNARVGTYYYFFPTYSQGKRVIWDGIDDNGRRFLDYFPRELFPLNRRNETELRLEAINGSAFQIIGTDRLDAVVGTNQVGCVFSEYALQNPRGWDLIRPILVQNKGWAVFITTPRGHNHAYDLWKKAQDRETWYKQLLTIKDTFRNDGTPVITEHDVEQEILEGMDADLARQEFYCSFDIGVVGSYYSKILELLEKKGQITSVPHDPRLSVDTYWDLGIDDSMVIWFVQQYGKEIRIIDYYENSGEGLPFYKDVLWERKRDRGYNYGTFNFPFDIAVKELSTGKSRLEIASSLGLVPNFVVPKLNLQDGIHAVRTTLPMCWFDAERCKEGIEALRNYHKKYDEINKVFMTTPAHDWSSHGADGFRTLAVGLQEKSTGEHQDRAITDFDVFGYSKGPVFGKQDEAETDFQIFNS